MALCVVLGDMGYTPRPMGTRSLANNKRDGHIPLEPTDTACMGKVRGKVGTGDPSEPAYCGQGAGWGTDHPGVGRCKFHGGGSPTYTAEAQRLLRERALETFGLPREVDPHVALLEELARTAGHVEWLRDRVAELDHKGVQKYQSEMVGPTGGGENGYPEWKPSVWIGMYNREREHLVKVAKTCIEAGIEERRVRLAEQQGQTMALVIKGILSDLGVLDDPRAPEIVRDHLTRASQGAITVEAVEV